MQLTGVTVIFEKLEQFQSWSNPPEAANEALGHDTLLEGHDSKLVFVSNSCHHLSLTWVETITRGKVNTPSSGVITGSFGSTQS